LLYLASAADCTATGFLTHYDGFVADFSIDLTVFVFSFRYLFVCLFSAVIEGGNEVEYEYVFIHSFIHVRLLYVLTDCNSYDKQINLFWTIFAYFE